MNSLTPKTTQSIVMHQSVLGTGEGWAGEGGCELDIVKISSLIHHPWAKTFLGGGPRSQARNHLILAFELQLQRLSPASFSLQSLCLKGSCSILYVSM